MRRALAILIAAAALTVVVTQVVTVIAVTNTTSTLEDIAADQAATSDTLDDIAANTAPSVLLRSFCEDASELQDMYEDMVYDAYGVDNIHKQAHAQREFRLQVLIYCNR